MDSGLYIHPYSWYNSLSESKRVYGFIFIHFGATPTKSIPVVRYHLTGGNRTMVAAATIVIMAAADGERISIFPLVCPDKARSV